LTKKRPQGISDERAEKLKKRNAKIMRLYRKGCSREEMAEKAGCTEEAVKCVIYKLRGGIVKKERKDRRDKIASLYNEGMNTKDIMETVGCGKWVVGEVLKEIRGTSTARKESNFSNKSKESAKIRASKVVDMYKKGMSVREICEETGIGRMTVGKYLKGDKDEDSCAKIRESFEKIWRLPEFENAVYGTDDYRLFTGEMPEYDLYLEEKKKVDDKRAKVLSRGEIPVWMKPCYVGSKLTASQEFHLFRKYNFYKHLAEKQFKKKRNTNAKKFVKLANEVKKTICESNFRLAIKPAKYYTDLNIDDGDKVSFCYERITIAVDYFDYRKGNRFSTYSIWAIRHALSKENNKNIKREMQNKTILNAMGKDGGKMADSLEASECVGDEVKRNELMGKVLNTLIMSMRKDEILSQREESIIRERYGFGAEEKKVRDLADTWGISKTRIGQIENEALEKMNDFRSVLRKFL